MQMQHVKKVKIIINGLRDEEINFNRHSGGHEFRIMQKEVSPSLPPLSNDKAELSNEDDEDDRVKWTPEQDKILQSAVQILGFSNYTKIAQEWFDGSKSECDCRRRWLKLDQSLAKRKLQFGKEDPNKEICSFLGIHSQSNKNLLKHKPLTIRRRRELEAKEERRLFGKASRSSVEKQLIHRAYIVGQTSIDQILRMNAIEENSRHEAISFSSVVINMKKINSAEVKNSFKSTLKAVQKLPRAVMELKDEEVMSPVRTTNMERSTSDTTEKFMNFISTELPISDVIESSKSQILKTNETHEFVEEKTVNEERFSDTTSLDEFYSPPLKCAFPCLPIINTPKQHTMSQMPFFLFKSSIPS